MDRLDGTVVKMFQHIVHSYQIQTLEDLSSVKCFALQKKTFFHSGWSYF